MREASHEERCQSKGMKEGTQRCPVHMRGSGVKEVGAALGKEAEVKVRMCACGWRYARAARWERSRLWDR